MFLPSRVPHCAITYCDVAFLRCLPSDDASRKAVATPSSTFRCLSVTAVHANWSLRVVELMEGVPALKATISDTTPLTWPTMPLKGYEMAVPVSASHIFYLTGWVAEDDSKYCVLRPPQIAAALFLAIVLLFLTAFTESGAFQEEDELDDDGQVGGEGVSAT
ncbi:unnamed protein product [Dibothriocephalus latus]|uniref:Uncharacterized protein n=1 Tax=Dibothriocephalus latus TaxID=60516 RepID=A0A3P7N565_DIBLA|nr:unnamed protein product [Dibothriocephalus latus]